MGIFGTACKGLHCAGCGKGIPAGIVGVLVIITILAWHSANAIAVLMRDVLIGAGVFAICAAIAAGIIIKAITMRTPVMGMRWDGETQCEVKRRVDSIPELVPQWPNRAAIEPANEWLNPERRTQEMPIPQDTWT